MGIFPTFPVILDSCVLFPLPLRDTLLRAAEAGLYRPHWSAEILDGAIRNLIAKGKLKSAERLAALLDDSFPEAMVQVPDRLIEVMTNDPGDRHVLAAAVAIKAQVIVTFNLKHFEPAAVEPWQLAVHHPDVFLGHLLDLAPDVMVDVVEQQAAALTRPPMTVEQLLDRLAGQVPAFADGIKALFAARAI